MPDPDERFDTIELRDPLFRLIRRAQAAVVDDLPKGFGLSEGELQRQDKPAIPLKVIREALVNALMHRNYRSHSPVQIIRYANRLEIRNPGFSLKSPEHLGDPGSQPRNPKIAAVLHETRFAETKGSGIRVMRESMEQAGLTPPLFESDRGNDQFVARYFFHHFLGEGDIAWLSQFRDLQLSTEEAKALIVVREAGAIDNSTYRELNKVDVIAASGALRRLRDAGVLTQKGRGSATYYVPTERVTSQAVLSGNHPALPGNLETLSGNQPPQSVNPSTTADAPGTRDMQLANEGLGHGYDVRKSLLAQIPGDLAAAVGALGKRSSPDQVKLVIIKLCGVRAWSAEELSVLISRNVKHLRETYLRPLVKEKMIEMTIPDEPNDPNQAYTAILTK